MDKEAILRKHVPTITFDKLIGTPIKQVFIAMDEYAILSSTELRKENEELRKAFETNKEQLMELATHATDLQSQIAEQQRTIDEFRVLLEECEEYMDDRSDADNGIPNKEMNMLCEIQSLLSKQ